MTCKECLDSLNAYVDGELAADEAAEMRDHLATCDDCAEAHTRLVEGTIRLKGALMRYEAPDVLKARLRATLAQQGADITSGRPATVVYRKVTWSTVALVAGIVGIVSSVVTMSVAYRTPSLATIENELLASHVRSLMPGHLTDVASNDQHNVKPWFNGRVDISPTVPRLDSLGFPLVGGRLDYVNGRTVPVIVYARRQHVINVYSWPSIEPGGQPSAPISNHGYNFIHLFRNGEEFWFVSDLNEAELSSFAKLFMSS